MWQGWNRLHYMIWEQLTLLGRFELLALYYCLRLTHFFPSDLRTWCLKQFSFLPAWSHLKKCYKDLSILGSKLIVSVYEHLSCDIVHTGINAAVKHTAFIFSLPPEESVSTFFFHSVGIYQTNYQAQVLWDPNLHSPLGYTIHNVVQGAPQQVYNELIQKTANYAILLTTLINNINNNKVQSYLIYVALYYPPINIQTSWWQLPPHINYI